MDSLYFLAPFLNDYCIDLCSFGMGMCKLDWGNLERSDNYMVGIERL